jgi:uncharacterized protein YdcH (DUF465 family)
MRSYSCHGKQKINLVFHEDAHLQNTANTVVLIAAVIALTTALVPFGKWVWRTYGVRKFDAKKAHYEELVEEANWYEDRLVRLDTFRKQLIYAKMYEQQPDRFKLAEMISKLDRKDAEWTRKIEDPEALALACEQKQEECQRNAQQCRDWAEDVAQKVLFW